MWSMEHDGEDIPEATEVSSLSFEPNQIPMLIEVFMPPVRARISNRCVKKTLTIPHWLNAEAERAGINFSQFLQSSLKEYLQIPDR